MNNKNNYLLSSTMVIRLDNISDHKSILFKLKYFSVSTLTVIPTTRRISIRLSKNVFSSNKIWAKGTFEFASKPFQI